MAIDAGMTVDIQQVDEGDLPQSSHCGHALGVHLPFLMRALHRLCFWFRQILMTFILANFLLFFQICRNPRPAWDPQSDKTFILGNFEPQGLCTPARMFFS